MIKWLSHQAVPALHKAFIYKRCPVYAVQARFNATATLFKGTPDNEDLCRSNLLNPPRHIEVLLHHSMDQSSQRPLHKRTYPLLSE